MRAMPGKRVLFVLVPVFLIFLVLYMMVNAAYTPTAQELRYPQGALSDSIFVGQNNVYTKNEALGKTHAFSLVPYLIDLPEGDGAKIGSGTAYRIADSYFAYFSEYPDYENIHDVISSQFPAALLSGYVPEKTKISTMVNRFGFINGFSAEYIVEYIQVADAKSEKTAVVMGYALEVAKEQFEGMKMFVGVGTTAYDNESGEKCAVILDSIINTVRFDKKLAAAILKNRPGYAKEEGAMADGSVTNIPIVARDAYDTLVLEVSFSRGNPDAVLELFLPDGLSFCDPVEQRGDYAKFVLDQTAAGVYNLRIQNYAGCGDIKTTIGSHVRGEAKEGG